MEESKIVSCKCGKFIGVKTSNGYLIGDLLFKDFHAVCPNCNEKWHCYKIAEPEDSKNLENNA
jgi:hypothetical protein